MARSIIDCLGRTISIGDKVKTPNGKVVKVTGAAIGVEFHNAEKCELVHKDTLTTEEEHKKHHDEANKHAGGDSVKPVSGAQRDDTDCIIWGN